MSATTMHSSALYYPYIHMRNEEWLKATLLFFPHVIRLLPRGFVPNDSPFVRELAQTEGRLKQSLVRSYRIGGTQRAEETGGEESEDVAHDAGLRMVRWILAEAQDETFKEQFSQNATAEEATRRKWENGDSTFQIHRDKLGREVWSQLEHIGLAWHPSTPDREHWVALHPRIGEAVMAAAAAAVARHRGLEIVTESPRVHWS